MQVWRISYGSNARGKDNRPTRIPNCTMCSWPAVARLWPDVLSNALEPGWVPTKMGGPGAPDDIDTAHRTQVWLGVSNDPNATVTGKYFYHMRLRVPNPVTHDQELQERLLAECNRVSGVDLPIV